MFAKYVEEQDPTLYVFVATMICTANTGIMWREDDYFSSASKAEQFINKRCEDFTTNASAWATNSQGDCSCVLSDFTYKASIHRHEVL